MSKHKRIKRSAAPNVRRRLQGRYLPESKPAQASEFLYHLKKYLIQYPDVIALIYARESTYAQAYRKNIDNHIKVLCRKLKKMKIPILGYYSEISSGWILNDDRWALVKAVKKAIKHTRKGKSVVIVTTSSDRFLRNEYFTTNKPNILPTKAEFEKLKKLTCNIPLVTLLHPDMPTMEVRSWQTKWGQRAKDNKGGRPKKNPSGYKKKRRLKKLPQVLRLRKNGTSWRKIKTLTGVAPATAAEWVRKYA